MKRTVAGARMVFALSLPMSVGWGCSSAKNAAATSTADQPAAPGASPSPSASPDHPTTASVMVGTLALGLTDASVGLTAPQAQAVANAGSAAVGAQSAKLHLLDAST